MSSSRPEPSRKSREQKGVVQFVARIDHQAANHPRDGLPSLTAWSTDPDGPQANIVSVLPDDAAGSMIGIASGVEEAANVIRRMLSHLEQSTGDTRRVIVRMHPMVEQTPQRPGRAPQPRGSVGIQRGGVSSDGSSSWTAAAAAAGPEPAAASSNARSDEVAEAAATRDAMRGGSSGLRST